MSYVLSAAAAAELADAARYCKAHFGAAAAENFLAQFESKTRLIAEFPDLGTLAPKDRRLMPIGRYPFSILYRVDEGVVRISAIAHHRRRANYRQRR